MPEWTSQYFHLEELVHFDPGYPDQNIVDYFRDLDNVAIHLPHVTQKERAKLVWKTSFPVSEMTTTSFAKHW